MSALEENRYLPVFALLALIITLQSFLIGEDKKQGDLDRPVISQHTPFTAPRAQASQNPALAMARAGENAPADMNGPPTADAESDAGWVPYQAGQSMPGDDLDEPPAMPPPSPTAGASADDTSALAEETSGEDEPVSPIAPGKDEWIRPVPLGQIIEEAARDEAKTVMSAPHAKRDSQNPVMRATSVAPSGGTTIEVDVGDNLWRIARRYNVSGEEILRANKLTNGVLLPGQVLTIPHVAQIALPPGFDVVHVKEGETAIDVANRVGVPLIDLVRENDLASLYQIPGGTALRYKKPGAVPPDATVVEAPPPRTTNPEKTGLMMPVVGKIGDRFGWRKHPILNETLFHTGLDLRAPRGEPIRAAQDGRVIYSGWLRGYGQTVVLRHVGGYTTRYGHCSQLLKKRGDKVKRGERIAKVGTSGLSTGPHVHFEVRLMGKPVNPLKFLKRGTARS